MKPGLFTSTVLPSSPTEPVDQASAGLSRRSVGAALLAAGLLSGCGFKLRGRQNFAFTSIAIQPSPGSALVQELRRSFDSNVRVLKADEPQTQAQVVLKVLGEQREQTVVGLSSSGQVRDLQLRLRVTFRLDTPQGDELIASNEIWQQRDVSYNESAALAKETEIATLYRDMQTDIAQQIQRRLAALKKLP
jgi:LPS-assembly lipoprotein